MTPTETHLDRLIAFPTVSRDSNLDLIAYVREALDGFGIASQLVPSEDGRKANLFATVGPKDKPGIVLSGHSDVVPVEGQDWTSDPFRMVERDGKFYGRGSADMKGFIAACLAMAPAALMRELTIPIHFAFSYDEEVGCLGVRRLISMLKDVEPRPRMVIIGEPTSMQAVTAHKGKLGRRVVAHGLEAHSSLAPMGVNAIYMTSDLITEIRAIQDDIARNGARDGDYEVAYTTLHVGKISGGEALNIVPNLCQMDYEVRHLPADDGEAVLQLIELKADAIAARARKMHPRARFEFTALPSYPALDTPVDSEAVNFVRRLTGGNSTGKISFGTEGGLFTRDLGVPAVVCGPGSIAVAHKPDEYISRDQLKQCDAMLARLVDALAV
ncbi:MAG: acetylornithine deacetylase [Rhizobiales bacterium]|nr:acetylornithine deacetylase [Hyphomicrobiales bacterium]